MQKKRPKKSMAAKFCINLRFCNDVEPATGKVSAGRLYRGADGYYWVALEKKGSRPAESGTRGGLQAFTAAGRLTNAEEK
jgi:hypothetical protein